MRSQNHKSEDDKKILNLIDWLSPIKILTNTKRTHNDAHVELNLANFSHLLGLLQQPLINEDSGSLLGLRVTELKNLMQNILRNYLTHKGNKFTVLPEDFEAIKKLEYQIKAILLVQNLNNQAKSNIDEGFKKLCVSFIKDACAPIPKDNKDEYMNRLTDDLIKVIENSRLQMQHPGNEHLRLIVLTLLEILPNKTRIERKDNPQRPVSKATVMPQVSNTNKITHNPGELHFRDPIKSQGHKRSKTDMPTSAAFNLGANLKKTAPQKDPKPTTSNKITSPKKTKKHQHHHTLLTPPTGKYKKP